MFVVLFFASLLLSPVTAWGSTRPPSPLASNIQVSTTASSITISGSLNADAVQYETSQPKWDFSTWFFAVRYGTVTTKTGAYPSMGNELRFTPSGSNFSVTIQNLTENNYAYLLQTETQYGNIVPLMATFGTFKIGNPAAPKDQTITAMTATNITATPGAGTVTIAGTVSQNAIDFANDIVRSKNTTFTVAYRADASNSWQYNPFTPTKDGGFSSAIGNLPAGKYAFQIMIDTANHTSMQNLSSLATFTIATPGVAPATNKGYGPNAYGCSTDGENNTYCMLAPLPIVDKQGNIDPTGKLNVSTGVGDYIKGIIKLIMGLIGVFAVLMVVVGGIEYMSTIQVGEKEGAKNRIINALGGVVLALASYLILNTINPNLVNITVSAPQAVLELEENYSPTADIGQPLPPDTPDGTPPTGTTDVKNDNKNFNAVLSAAAASHPGVSCTFMKAIMYRESNGNPGATSSVGAYGLMQMMPATWTGLGYSNQSKWSDPAVAADAAAKYIQNLSTTACNNAASSNVCTASSMKNIAAAYNGGPKANKESKSCPGTTLWECYVNWTPRPNSYRQTKRYVDTVLNNYNKLTSEGWGC